MPTLYVFLRHAESVANVSGWLSGWEDVALTARGTEQALAAGGAIRAIEERHGPLRRCLVSDLGRARTTADLAAPHLRKHVLAELRERNMGALQGVDIAITKGDGRYEQLLRPWGVGPPGGESHRECSRRGLACLRAWDDGSPTLVVAHGSLLRNVVGLVDGLTPEDIGRGPPAPHAEPMVRWIEGWPRA
jgi:2,3-bisphosphoglycerate-dependent phosphoglycerate mutase